jgi:hypothetical protein
VFRIPEVSTKIGQCFYWQIFTMSSELIYVFFVPYLFHWESCTLLVFAHTNWIPAEEHPVHRRQKQAPSRFHSHPAVLPDNNCHE